jgi:phosphopentomutase
MTKRIILIAAEVLKGFDNFLPKIVKTKTLNDEDVLILTATTGAIRLTNFIQTI